MIKCTETKSKLCNGLADIWGERGRRMVVFKPQQYSCSFQLFEEMTFPQAFLTWCKSEPPTYFFFIDTCFIQPF